MRYLTDGAGRPYYWDMNTTRPTMQPAETLAAYITRMDAWKDQGEWIPACGGTEVAFLTRGGATLLYCYQPRSGKHAYLDVGTDLILTDDEANALLGRF